MMKSIIGAAFLIITFVEIQQIKGHGMLMDPVNRASRWRVDPSAPADYNDNEGFCGGFDIQYNNNGGKCGLCGDNYANPTPRAHELGGTYGQGVIVKTYTPGSLIETNVKLSANHLGFFSFHICKIDGNGESETCFNNNPVLFEDGSSKYPVVAGINLFNPKIRLPSGLSCDHCVLRWAYTTGNRWGWCDANSGELGCGPQEMFVGCSDIAIKV
ncbi:hypothetical protein ACFFRR_000799 [Megaselia abdita]